MAKRRADKPDSRKRGFGPGRSRLRQAQGARRHGLFNLWYHYSSRLRRDVVLRSDVEFDHFCWLEGEANVLRYELEPPPIMVAIGEESRWPVEGIASASELRQVMSCYDDPLLGEYPQHSNCSFTQFFLPQAYEHGWRLAACAALCWEQFKAHATARLNTPAAPKLSVGMEWVSGAIQFAFTHYSDLDRPQFMISAREWSAAIESTGFKDSLGLTYHPNWSTQL